jgi:hypothetical protein
MWNMLNRHSLRPPLVRSRVTARVRNRSMVQLPTMRRELKTVRVPVCYLEVGTNTGRRNQSKER